MRPEIDDVLTCPTLWSTLTRYSVRHVLQVISFGVFCVWCALQVIGFPEQLPILRPVSLYKDYSVSETGESVQRMIPEVARSASNIKDIHAQQKNGALLQFSLFRSNFRRTKLIDLEGLLKPIL